MKKFKTFLGCLLLIGCLIFTLTGCTNSEIEEAQDKLESVREDFVDGETDASNLEAAMNEYADSIEGNINGYYDINKYIADVKKGDAYEQTLESLKGSGLDLELMVDGNNLIYKYTYTVPVVENVAEIVNANFETNDSTFTTTANAIRIEAPCVEKVVWAYYTSNGELITSLTK